MGNSTEQFGFKVGLQNAEEKEPCNLSIMTLERVYKIIESKSFEPKLTVEMKKLAAKYPQQALENFIAKFDTHLLKARKNLRLSKPTTSPVELGDEQPQKDDNYVPKVDEFE